MAYDFLINFGIFQTSVVELAAVLSGLISVWLVKKENVWAFPIGGVSVLLSAYIYFRGNIYANAGINLFYFIMNIYGWYNWLRKTGGHDLFLQPEGNSVLYPADDHFILRPLVPPEDDAP